MGNMRNEKEIKKMIELLIEERKSLPGTSAFGDSNRVIRNAQIDALDWVLGYREMEDLL